MTDGVGLERSLAHRLRSRAAPDRGWAHSRLWSALYGARYCNDYEGLSVAKAPARPGGRALRGGAFGTSIPRIGAKS
jgi:hypothetical protein